MRDFRNLLLGGVVALTWATGVFCPTPASAEWLSRIGIPTGDAAAGASATPAEVAFQKGELERAKRLAFERDDASSMLVRAHLAEYDGDLELAQRFAANAEVSARDAELRARAAALAGRLQSELGEFEAAENYLRTFLAAHTDALPVRLELGRMLAKRGAQAEANAVLKPFSRAFNSGRITTARQLAWLGEAMWEMGSFDDANYAFQKMYELDARYVDGLVSLAELLLSKYNQVDALATLEEALKINPKHPGALVAMAELEIQTSNYFDDARDYLARVEKVWRTSPKMLVTRAKLQIYDSDCAGAVKSANAVLADRPRAVEAMIIKAACHYLNDERPAFEAVVEQALAIQPDLARIFTETATYAQMVHRYSEVIALNERALKLRPGYPPALLDLGIGLSRVRRESEGVEYLRKAFEADPYNIRAYNMVELYDKTMSEYEFQTYDTFRLRTRRDQSDVLNLVVPSLVGEAIETFGAKYNYKVPEKVDVEVFPEPATFGVRSVGLPQISPTGLCFGQVVISRSPSDGNFNWRQVIWHEMAHVYHIQKAGYRVPRWFTEGLAEYETNVKDPAWARHRDGEIVTMMRENDLPSVVDLDKRFTQARSFKGILRAYHLSSLAIHYIVETHGFAAINRMLETFPDALKTGLVIEKALETDVASFDAGFKKWLEARYLNFRQQVLVSVDGIEPIRVLQEKLSKRPNDPVLRAQLSYAQIANGETERAKQNIKHALNSAPKNSTVRYLAALIEFRQGHTRDAYAHGMAILDEFEDGYELRVLLGYAAMMLEMPVDARVHLDAATQLYEDGTEAWANLLKLAESQKDAALQERAELRLFELNQNDPQIARKRFERMMAKKDWAQAAVAAERWVAIEAFEPRAQRALARVSLAQKNAPRAAQAYQVLVRLVPGEAAAMRKEAANALKSAGFAAEAKPFEQVDELK
ncbi:tetratricopeptide repeat protein [Bradymonas sediminis]|uniref:Uncharacterized protein n=1 Tax=Bradymonas sediminis TaxID=1548548 RepID=A0A2Z4FIG7_9DELT|nr:tetratricopeptide repeat protein [Bradymonas sediminis]AWV88807.1 hypothetical protein DN745_05420 [Bradymonas sediminis]TDP71805.1 Tfp pilus assembly protein PilF [Bradymonas sediminis]